MLTDVKIFDVYQGGQIASGSKSIAFALTFQADRTLTVEEVNALLKKASETDMKGILGYSDKPLVSIDYNGDDRSSIVDGLSTMVMDGTMLKIMAWYDNEWGYSCRVVDLAAYVGKNL